MLKMAMLLALAMTKAEMIKERGGPPCEEYVAPNKAAVAETCMSMPETPRRLCLARGLAAKRFTMFHYCAGKCSPHCASASEYFAADDDIFLNLTAPVVPST